VIDLPIGKVHAALVAVVGEGQRAGFASHVQRLQQVQDVHLRQAAAQHGFAGSFTCHFFQRDLVYNFLDPRRGFLQEERLFDKVFHRVLHVLKFLREVNLAGHQDHGNVGAGVAGLDLLQELPAVHAVHGIVGDDQVRLIFNGFEQSVRGVGFRVHGRKMGKRLPQHLQNHGVVVNQQDLDATWHASYLFRWSWEGFRRNSPLFPPDLRSKTISRMAILLSRALHMS